MRALIIAVIAAALLPPQSSGVTTLDGQTIDPLAPRGPAVAALIFTRTDCPVANQAAPEIERLRRDFAGRDVRIWLVYLDREESSERIRAHQRDYGLGATAVRDMDHALARKTGVHVTPEAAVFVFDGDVPRLVYRGRLDNRVAELGRLRPSATRFDLREALESALARTSNALVTTQAAGCEIADLR